MEWRRSQARYTRNHSNSQDAAVGLSQTSVKRHKRRQEFEYPSFASDLAPLSDTIRLMMERNEPIPEMHGNDQSCQ